MRSCHTLQQAHLLLEAGQPLRRQPHTQGLVVFLVEVGHFDSEGVSGLIASQALAGWVGWWYLGGSTCTAALAGQVLTPSVTTNPLKRYRLSASNS